MKKRVEFIWDALLLIPVLCMKSRVETKYNWVNVEDMKMPINKHNLPHCKWNETSNGQNVFDFYFSICCFFVACPIFQFFFFLLFIRHATVYSLCVCAECICRCCCFHFGCWYWYCYCWCSIMHISFSIKEVKTNTRSFNALKRTISFLTSIERIFPFIISML